jgi:hypothetical protein
MERFNAINEAICYWLGYQFKIGRERLIHEASLRFPIADTLTSKGTEINRIQLEKGYPCFIDRLVDIFVFDKAINDLTDDNWIDSIFEIYELKIAKKDSGNKYGQENQRIVDDILRLAYFNISTGKAAYFLICGRYQDFKNYFIGQKDAPQKDQDENIIIKERRSEAKITDSNNDIGWNINNSLYKDYFDFEFSSPPKPKEYTFFLNTLTGTESEEIGKEKFFGLNSFQSRYKIKDSLFIWGESIKIKTTCIAITPFENITHRTHACGIWKIEAE